MKTRALLARATATAAGATLLIGVAGAALADDDYGSEDIDVNVSIDEYPEPGVLALTVASDATTLTETGTDPTVREFTGTLPTVTVTDTRVFPDRIDPAAFWYVLGSSSDFEGDAGQPDIPAGHLGWAPALVGGTDPEKSPPATRSTPSWTLDPTPWAWSTRSSWLSRPDPRTSTPPGPGPSTPACS